MPRQPDYKGFRESIAKELMATQDRVRNLIGSSHWLSDGEHKEAILRKTLRNHVSSAFHIGKGFVCTSDWVSRQIDILVTDNNHPTLFKDGDLRIVTPDAVRAIIEVKTKIQSKSSLIEIAKTLAGVASEVRRSNRLTHCWAGLFVFEDEGMSHENILSALSEVAEGYENKVIDCLAIGPDIFVRYWHNGQDVNSPMNGSVWHSYQIHNLAFSYFVGNLVADYLSWHQSLHSQYAWFPIENGKERYRKAYIGLQGDQPSLFDA